MELTRGTREIRRAVCEGTGLSPGELVLVLAAAAAATALVGLLRTVEVVIDAWPISTDRS
jgi:hypothetical protein